MLVLHAIGGTDDIRSLYPTTRFGEGIVLDEPRVNAGHLSTSGSFSLGSHCARYKIDAKQEQMIDRRQHCMCVRVKLSV